MRLLVVTSEPITADQLRQVLPADADPEQQEVVVVAPALQESGVRFWFSDVDEAIARARAVNRKTVAQLGAEGVDAAEIEERFGIPVDRAADSA
jgi:hypothetical protein